MENFVVVKLIRSHWLVSHEIFLRKHDETQRTATPHSFLWVSIVDSYVFENISLSSTLIVMARLNFTIYKEYLNVRQYI